MEELLTTEEVARILRVSRPTVLNWLQQGKIPGLKLGEGRGVEWRVRRQDLDSYLSEHLRPGPTPSKEPPKGPGRGQFPR